MSAIPFVLALGAIAMIIAWHVVDTLNHGGEGKSGILSMNDQAGYKSKKTDAAGWRGRPGRFSRPHRK
jgi:hypothetical protein